MQFIFKDRFWLVHILFISMVKFQFIAQFRVNQLSHLDVSRLCCYFHYYFTLYKFFTSASASGLTQEFE